MAFELKITQSDSDKEMEDEVKTALISFFARVQRYGYSSVCMDKKDISESCKHFDDFLKKHGQHVHNGYLSKASRELAKNKTIIFARDTLIGRHYVICRGFEEKGRARLSGARLLPLPSVHGRYFVCIGNGTVAFEKYKKPVLLIVKSHCLMRMKERGDYDELTALELIANEVIFNQIIEPDEAEVCIGFGDKSVKIETTHINTTYSEKEKTREDQYFAVICRTFY